MINSKQQNMQQGMQRTKFPPGLDETHVRVVEQIRNGSVQKVGLGLEVGIENANVVAQADVTPLHPFSKSSGLVPDPVWPDFILNVDSLSCPPLTFGVYESLQNKTVHLNDLDTDLKTY